MPLLTQKALAGHCTVYFDGASVIALFHKELQIAHMSNLYIMHTFASGSLKEVTVWGFWRLFLFLQLDWTPHVKWKEYMQFHP